MLSGPKTWLKATLQEFGFALGLGARLLQITQSRLILCYHGVDPVGERRFNSRHTAVGCFVRQLKWLRRHYPIVSIPQLFDDPSDSQTRLAITLDDGYENNFTYALPVLESLRLPATMFITGVGALDEKVLWADAVEIAGALSDSPVTIAGTKYVKNGDGRYVALDGGELLSSRCRLSNYAFKREVVNELQRCTGFMDRPELSCYWKLMNEGQIRQLANSRYVQIGSHGYYHNNLGVIPIDDALDELQRSQRYLSTLAQRPIDQLAYPDGSYSPVLVEKARQYGFRYQLAVRYQNPQDANLPGLLERCSLASTAGCYNQLLNAISATPRSLP